ncbi:hypothetical protein PILCRDRAFT_830539 [Piloderma croceum F 1598]|uniref:Uncharacterized protein n=1 Tax=Piloderma croceum (strain F 1598) TaxID=765440 RepID=A0A0C3EEQ1_PILCF|nr:hypothetical protein PILCRDRAFT_830539 [Piloderma croceum F 1598]
MHILLELCTQDLLKLLSRQTLNSNFRNANAEYFNANVMLLLQTLYDETDGGAGGSNEGRRRCKSCYEGEVYQFF